MEKKIKVRFNLGRGKNYKKWKVEIPGSKPSYYDPKKVQLVMLDCTLHNDKSVAEGIYKGKSKRVCAWISPEVLLVLKKGEQVPYEASDALNIVRYNPKIAPNWMYLSQNVDGFFYERLLTKDNLVFNRLES